MRARLAAALGAASLTAAGALVACIDLFHGTDDILTACQIDAAVPGCGDAGAAVPEAGPEAAPPTDFCKWDDTTALANARHACAWLAACETPMGGNALGPCMFEALLAYDCAANPDHRAQGEAHRLWDCLWQATTCSAVDACVFPSGPQACGSNGTACATATDNLDVRVECVDGGKTHGENCALWGQTCASSPATGGVCAGSGGAAGVACNAQECAGTSLHWCVDGGDIGLDCASNGAQSCGGYPDASSATWIACVPGGDGAACAPSLAVTCDAGLATTCLTGAVESLNCKSLLGSVDSCESADALAPPFDWRAACAIDLADASPCVEACGGGEPPTTLTGCTRGATYTLDCTQVGLGPCRVVTTDVGHGAHPACTPPHG